METTFCLIWRVNIVFLNHKNRQLIQASDSKWTVVDVPKFSKYAKTTYKLNQNFEKISISGTIGYEDQYQLFIDTPDWTSGNEVGDLITNYKDNSFNMWLPDTR